jgi:hypothetical protein
MSQVREISSAKSIVCFLAVGLLTSCQTVSHPEVFLESGLSPLISITFGSNALGNAAEHIALKNNHVQIIKGSQGTNLGVFEGLSWIDVSSDAPINLDSLTIVTRVKTDFPKYWQALFNSKGWADNDLHDQFKGNKLEFAIGGNLPSSAEAEYTFQSGFWYDLVVTYSTSTHKTVFFVNGKRVSETKYTTSKPIKIANHQIGAWTDDDRNFQGQMMYFYLFPGVLDDSLISRYYGVNEK